MWFGVTDRLRLFMIEELVEGDYDWNGYDWAAHLRGRFTRNVFAFDWWWGYTPESGGQGRKLMGIRFSGTIPIVRGMNGDTNVSACSYMTDCRN